MKEFDHSRQAEQESNCPICLNELTNKSSIDCCLHTFCFKCIARWGKVSIILSQTQTKCPVCRRAFSTVTDRRKKIRRFEQKISEPARRMIRGIGLVRFVPMVVYTSVCIVPVQPMLNPLNESYFRIVSASSQPQFL